MSFQEPILSGVSASPTYQVCACAILVLLSVRY